MRRTRTDPKSSAAPDALRSHDSDLRRRYSTTDLGVLTEAEAKRFLASASADPQSDVTLAWELLYRLEPELYDRLATAERLHPSILGWLPRHVDRIVEVGAGTGRLTLELAHRAREVVAIEPAAPLRKLLAQKLLHANHGHRVRLVDGFFDDLPVSGDWADLVITCSAFTPAPGHGGEAGLAQLERVCRPGGTVAIVWPNHIDWLTARGYHYVAFPGEMFVEFASPAEAAELIPIFYPTAAAEALRDDQRRVSFSSLGINPPRDLAFKVKAE